MATACPSIGVIRAQIRAIRNKAPKAKVFGIFTPGRWTGPSVRRRRSRRDCDLPMRFAAANASGLAERTRNSIRNGIGDAAGSGEGQRRHPRPIGTAETPPDQQLGDRPVPVQGQDLDPRITRHAFLADLLLEHAGDRDFPPVAGGLLDADTVWSHPAGGATWLSSCAPGCGGNLAVYGRNLILRADGKLVQQSSGRRQQHGSARQREMQPMLFFRCVGTEHGPKALAIGLVMGVIYHESVGHELDRAAGRLEAYVGTTNLPTELARRWRDAASIAAGQLSKLTMRRCLDEAEAILENIGAANHAWRSGELESGFEQRLSRLGHALATHVDSRATAIPEEIQKSTRQYPSNIGWVAPAAAGWNGLRWLFGWRVGWRIRLLRVMQDHRACWLSPSSMLSIADTWTGRVRFYVEANPIRILRRRLYGWWIALRNCAKTRTSNLGGPSRSSGQWVMRLQA